ncbi:hypothetical protein [Arthrobacter psychrochitiniphilus]|nr:hypothetical protein [Arthrobacter psychrochitiniphilus]
MRDTQIIGNASVHLGDAEGHVSAWGLHIHGGAWMSLSPSSHGGKTRIGLGKAMIDADGTLLITVADGSRKGDVDLWGADVQGDLRLYGNGTACEAKSVRLTDLTTTGEGGLTIQGELGTAAGVIHPPLAGSSARHRLVKLGEWTVVDD